MIGTRSEDKHRGKTLFLLCWFVYFVTYIGRLNYSSAMPVMIQEGYLLKSQAGVISMVFFFAYGIGQLCNGFLGDKINPGKMIFTGLLVSACSNFFMGVVENYQWMVVLWGINGYMQSMIWPPIVRIFSDRLQPKERAAACIHITSTVAAGTLAAYFLSAMVLSMTRWQVVFGLAAMIMTVSAIIWYVGYARVEQSVQDQSKPKKELNGVTWKEEAREKTSFYKICISSGLLFLVLPVVAHGVLKDGMTNWVPTYITELFGVTPVFSVLVTMVLPVVNLSGAYAASFMNHKIFRNELKTAAFFFCLAMIALLILWRAGGVSIVLTVVLLSVITSSMLAVNTLFVNVIPMHFGSIGRSATVSGLLNAMAYIGSAVSTFTVGVVVERIGWSGVVFGWLMLAVVAAVVCVFICRKIRTF